MCILVAEVSVCVVSHIYFIWAKPLDNLVIPFEAFSDVPVKSMKTALWARLKACLSALFPHYVHTHTPTYTHAKQHNPNTHRPLLAALTAGVLLWNKHAGWNWVCPWPKATKIVCFFFCPCENQQIWWLKLRLDVKEWYQLNADHNFSEPKAKVTASNCFINALNN